MDKSEQQSDVIGHCNCCHEIIKSDGDLSPLGPPSVLICIDCANSNSRFVQQFRTPLKPNESFIGSDGKWSVF